MKRLVRSSAFRIALAFVLALVTTTYAVFALVYLQYYRSTVSLTRHLLEEEIRATRDTPLVRLEDRLRLRLTRDLRHIDYVGLFDPAGKLMLGNLSPDLKVVKDGRAHTMRLPPPQPDTGPSTEVVAVAATRPDGDTIVLARNLSVVDELADTMLRAFAAAIVPAWFSRSPSASSSVCRRHAGSPRSRRRSVA